MAIKIALGLLLLLAGFIFYARRASSEVRVSRTFDAPVEKVWKLWNDPESMKLWWSPKDFTAPVIRHDLKVGGTFLLSMRSPKGEMYWNTGTYTEVVANKKIVSLLSFSDENGRILTGKEIPVPGVWPGAVTVTVEFSEEGGKTKVAIREEGIPMIMAVPAKMGWEQQFDKFERLI